MAKKKPDLGAQYREAKEAVASHLAKQADAELERVAVQRSLAGLPREELYDFADVAIHPDLIEADANVAAAVADVQWCMGLVIACGEAVKGIKFEDVPNLTAHEVQSKVADKIQKRVESERKAELAAAKKKAKK